MIHEKICSHPEPTAKVVERGEENRSRGRLL